ncbi:uncharacterized protein G2W53_014215 [Senna tora]|uniref:Uncharacterized protein n=1 Tax=Senna tora TaxID=362788 RepID=A0A834WT48_9FABA|nr:uncharacterized protein G2W53_014215 [Senna tora]
MAIKSSQNNRSFQASNVLCSCLLHSAANIRLQPGKRENA